MCTDLLLILLSKSAPSPVDQHPVVPRPDMRDMRNVVVHQCFGVDLRIVGDTVRKDVPPLVEPLIRVLRDEPEEET